ncbi:transmembrane and immunoglobulin domain-containing protein 2 [Oxyura jamaicensis]|uniref:transmembrane and immunoglobulin domain-containing protein 2 n=1 Tax=Oxyura jamaicensis TaxID=8884 RepID=UPI0015A64299|nr:transmembrane and immunoglobulin domain-containing protein 2 [Oxyura jamaicensis]
MGMWGLGVLVPLLGAGALWVIQDPSEVQVTAGEGVALGCWVVAAEPPQMLRVEWLKAAGHRVLCSARMGPAAPPAPCSPRLRLAWQPPHATLSILRARPGDAGCYVCRVTLEIPRHATATGNGTVLTVSAGTPGDGGRRGHVGTWGCCHPAVRHGAPLDLRPFLGSPSGF